MQHVREERRDGRSSPFCLLRRPALGLGASTGGMAPITDGGSMLSTLARKVVAPSTSISPNLAASRSRTALFLSQTSIVIIWTSVKQNITPPMH
jgi:hypothetical protein